MSSIGKDLITIRTHLGFTIQDVQNSTKIPLSTLKAIESGSIFEQSDEIKTYVRSFVRTYGRALKLDDELVVTALDQQEAGNYNHLLLTQFPELEIRTIKKTPDLPAGSEEKEKITEPTEESEQPASASAPSSKFITDFPEEEEEEKSEYIPTPPPGVRSVNWADMGKRFSTHSPKTPAWIIGAAVVLLVVLAAAYFLFQNNFFVSDEISVQPPITNEQPAQPDPEGSEFNLDITPGSPTESASAPRELDQTLYLTVYAANDILDPVRVWSDLKPRVDPYWIDQGVALNFEFRDSIRVRGQYSRMLLFMNGHLVENFRQEYFNPEENAVEITRDLFEDDPRWANTVPFQLPPDVQEPDSVANRPVF
jgi:hypothetical protein